MNSQDRIELLSRLFQERYGIVLGAVRQYAPAADMIDDIVQQVYMDFVFGAAAETWNLEKDVASLLYRIAKMKALNSWRERRRRRQTSLDDIAQEMVDSVLSYEESHAEEEYEQTIRLLEILENCLGKMSQKTREIVWRHYASGEPINKIGEQESVKTSTIYRFFRKVRIQLRKCIEQTLKNKGLEK